MRLVRGAAPLARWRGLALARGTLTVMALAQPLTGCSSLAIWSAPEKRPTAKPTPQSRAANEHFWQALHGGHYDELPQVLNELTAVYLDNPGDPETTAHIGFSHVWRVSESTRLTDRPANVTDDEKLVRRGYFTLLDAKDAWPEFNLFTAGYSLSRLPHNDKKYADAVEYQWKTLDLCAEEPVDRKTATFSSYMNKETQTGPKRACWNSWIAPHNFEGFFLNMGDMVVKQGDPETARRIYADAKLSKTYDRWPYRDVLEERISQAEENVAIFRRLANPKENEKRRTMMVSSAFACTGCHQAL